MSQARPISRRALLFGRSGDEPPVSPPRAGRADSSQARSAQTLRPPWALRGAAFANACTGCVACVDACPEQVLVLRKGKAAFEPERGECTFCHACVDACAPGALRDDGVQPPWTYRATVDEACLGAHGVVCASCREICPQSAIRIPPAGRGAAHIDSDGCNGCGACVSVCPATAIHLHASAETAA
ncbi:ferredoxin-type protein NapF [Pseudoxanthomonas sp. 22568]|uniref:ferredoxin-type protein NapF n=1 Tax=Pseudoxanthomonas sp. 22568 TaxID=3453945 RepID=UPI003F82EF17